MKAKPTPGIKAIKRPEPITKKYSNYKKKLRNEGPEKEPMRRPPAIYSNETYEQTLNKYQ